MYTNEVNGIKEYGGAFMNWEWRGNEYFVLIFVVDNLCCSCDSMYYCYCGTLQGMGGNEMYNGSTQCVVVWIG